MLQRESCSLGSGEQPKSLFSVVQPLKSAWCGGDLAVGYRTGLPRWDFVHYQAWVSGSDCLLSPGEAFWEFSAVRGRGKKALLCLPQFIFSWRMRFVPIKPQVFLNSLHSGDTCEQTDKMRFPLCSGDSPPPVHFEVYKWCSSVCPVCFVLCRWWLHLNWCWCLCLGTSFCSGVSLSGWRGTEGDCRPSCAELGLLESAFSAAWELLGCVNVALASCLETEGAARDSSWQWVPAAGSVDSSWMGC